MPFSVECFDFPVHGIVFPFRSRSTSLYAVVVESGKDVAHHPLLYSFHLCGKRIIFHTVTAHWYSNTIVYA